MMTYSQAIELCETMSACYLIWQLSQLALTHQHTPSEHHLPQSIYKQ